jgi:protein farnesyltransferase subunit beta
MSSLLQPLLPFETDDILTATSEEQFKTEGLIRELLSLYIPQAGSDKPAVLDVQSIELNRKAHVRWLTGILNPLPAPYTSLDASRPWLLYWVTHSLALMNVTLDKESKKRAIDTIKSFWNAEEGGFGGGPGQMAHLAPTYASVSALCYLVADDEEAAWSWLDR